MTGATAEERGDEEDGERDGKGERQDDGPGGGLGVLSRVIMGRRNLRRLAGAGHGLDLGDCLRARDLIRGDEVRTGAEMRPVIAAA